MSIHHPLGFNWHPFEGAGIIIHVGNNTNTSPIECLGCNETRGRMKPPMNKNQAGTSGQDHLLRRELPEDVWYALMVKRNTGR